MKVPTFIQCSCTYGEIPNNLTNKPCSLIYKEYTHFNFLFLIWLTDSYLAIRSSKLYGGLNAATFNDKSSWQYEAITAIRLECSGDLMYSIQMKYGDTWATKHGTDRSCAHLSCKSYTKLLAEDERITSVKMVIFNTWNIDFIHATTFNTNKGELITCGDVRPRPGRQIVVSQGHQLQYINGRSGDLVASLQFHWSENLNGMLHFYHA